MVTGRSFADGIKRPKHEADLSPPSVAEFKNEQSYTSFPSLRLNGMHKNNFTFDVTEYFLHYNKKIGQMFVVELVFGEQREASIWSDGFSSCGNK